MNQPQSTKPKPDTGQANGTGQDLKTHYSTSNSQGKGWIHNKIHNTTYTVKKVRLPGGTSPDNQQVRRVHAN